MKELNLTEGPWSFDGQNGTKGHCRMAQVWDGDGHNLATIESTENPERATSNAQAIVTAVNNTYHKGIDPEAVADMKEALKESQVLIEIMLEQQCGDYESISRQIRENRQALQKAGVTINENTE